MKRLSRLGALALCAGSLSLAGVVMAGAAEATRDVRGATRVPLLVAPVTAHVDTEASAGAKSLALAPTITSAEPAQTPEVTEAPKAADTAPEAAADHVELGDHAGPNVSVTTVQVTDVGVPQTWSGHLCDKTPASFTYVVGADGTISSVVPDPSTGTVHQESSKGVTVSFSHQERVQIRVVTNEDGSVQVRVHEKIHCEASDASTTASGTTTPEHAADDSKDDSADNSATDAADNGAADDQGDNASNDNGGDHHGSTHGSDHAGKHGSDDSAEHTSTTVAGSSTTVSDGSD